MDEEILETRIFFNSHHVPLSDLWLESCINWFREQHCGTNYSKKELCTRVYEQWLLLDLRDVEVPQLMPNELKEKKIVINRTLSLQLMSVVDISKPKLWQLQKIRNLHTLSASIEEAEDNQGYYNNNVNGKRVLQLKLTDGVHEIMALEYKTIPILNLDLIPGMKIRINPPVTVRRGQIMLEQHNIKLLGGEVEDIIVSNSAENILARALNLPENTNSINGEESRNLIVDMDNINSINNVAENSMLRINTNDNRPTTDNNNTTNNREKENHAQRTYVNAGRQDMTEEEQEELRIAAEIDMLMEVESDLELPPPMNTRINVTPDMFENVEDHNKSKQVVENKPEEDIFTSIDINQHLDKIEEQMRRLSQDKLYKIADLKEKWKGKVSGKYRVHAQFKSIVQKLTLAKSWILKISIADDSGELNVFVHSDVVSNVIGYSPDVVRKLKKDVEAKNSETISMVMKALDGLRDKLLKLNSLMEIEIGSSANDDTPIITAFL